MPGALALAERRSPPSDPHMEIFSRTLANCVFFHIFPKIAYFRGFSRIIWRFLLDSCEFLLENLKNFFYNIKNERFFPKIRKKCKKLSETLQFFTKITNFSRKMIKKMEKYGNFSLLTSVFSLWKSISRYWSRHIHSTIFYNFL